MTQPGAPLDYVIALLDEWEAAIIEFREWAATVRKREAK